MIGRILADRYRIIEALASSTVSKTYLASDTYRPGYPHCIVKQLQPLSSSSTSPQLVERLLKKRIDVLKELGKSDYAPKIIDFFRDDRAVYLVEELVPGRPLSQELLPDRPLSEHAVIRLLQAGLESLAFIHRHGVIHQNIQPSNLIRQPTDGRLILINFSLVREGNVPGANLEATPYQPPEQLQGNPHPNSDIYPLGIIAIQALTGRSAEAIVPLVQQSSPAWQQQIRVRRRLADIIDRMVRQDFRQRYQSTAHALHDVYRLAQEVGASVPPAPPPPPFLAQEQSPTWEDGPASPSQPELNPPTIEPPLPTAPLSMHLPLEAEPTSAEKASEVEAPDAVPPTQLQDPVANKRPLLVLAAVVLVMVGLIAVLQQLSTGSLAYYFSGRGVGRSQQPGANSTNQPNPSSSLDTAALFDRGLNQYRSGNLQQALDDFSQVIQQNPNHTDAYIKRANTRYQLGDRQGALEDYNRAIQLDSNAVQAYVNRGSVWSDLGNEQAAIADYTQAIQHDPTLAAAYLNRCLSRSNLNDQAGAIADCTQAISLKPSYAFAYQNRGLAYRRQGNTQRAIEDFNVAIRLTPDDADPYYNRGVARAELGDYQGAIQDFNTTVRLNPNHSFVYYDRGLAWAKLGDTPKALQDLERSAKLCLDQGRTACYKDAQYQISQLKQSQ